jgi:hypothetical protein
MTKARNADHDRRYNRDEELKAPAKAGRPPRPASEPKGAEASSRTAKTATDPMTGAPNRSSRGTDS